MKTRTQQTDQQVRRDMRRDIKIIRDELRCAVEDMNTNQWQSVAVLMNQIAGLACELRDQANEHQQGGN